MWYAGRVGIGETLAQALTRAAESAPVQAPTVEGGGEQAPPTTAVGSVPAGETATSAPPGTGTAPPPADEAAALVAMDEAAQALDAAKASGDLAAIGAASQQLENAVNDFLTLRGQSLNGANGGEAVPTSPAPTSGGG